MGQKKPPVQEKGHNIVPVLSGLLVYSCAMMLVPFVLFGGTVYGFFDPLFALTTGVPETSTKNTIAAILAVVGVNVVVGSFIFSAFREDNAKKPQSKED